MILTLLNKFQSKVIVGVTYFSIYFPPPAGAGLIAVFAPLRRPLRAAKPPSAAKPNTAGPK